MREIVVYWNPSMQQFAVEWREDGLCVGGSFIEPALMKFTARDEAFLKGLLDGDRKS